MAVNRRDLLERLQAELLSHLETCKTSESAPISKELRAVTAELESLAPAEVSSVDELTKRRADRRAKAAG